MPAKLGKGDALSRKMQRIQNINLDDDDIQLALQDLLPFYSQDDKGFVDVEAILKG